MMMPIIITKGHTHHLQNTALKSALFIVVDWSVDYWCEVAVVVVVCR